MVSLRWPGVIRRHARLMGFKVAQPCSMLSELVRPLYSKNSGVNSSWQSRLCPTTWAGPTECLTLASAKVGLHSSARRASPS
jgi:hypothetical protein